MVTEFHQGSQQREWNARYLSTWPQKSHSHFCHIPGQGHHKGLPRFKGRLNDLINWWDGCKLYRKGMWNITYHRGHIYKIALATVRRGSWDFISLVTRWSQCCWYCVWALSSKGLDCFLKSMDILERYCNGYFAATVITHQDQRHFKEKGVYFGFQYQRIRTHEGGVEAWYQAAGMKVAAGCWEFTPFTESMKQESELGVAGGFLH